MGPEYEKDEASQQVRRQIEPRQRSPRRRWTRRVFFKQAFSRQCLTLGIKSFIKCGVRPSLIPLLMSFFERLSNGGMSCQMSRTILSGARKDPVLASSNIYVRVMTILTWFLMKINLSSLMTILWLIPSTYQQLAWQVTTWSGMWPAMFLPTIKSLIAVIWEVRNKWIRLQICLTSRRWN